MAKRGKSESADFVSNPDHTHVCCCCGRTYECRGYLLEECRRKGVFKAITVNKDGPFCNSCREGTMFLRYCRHAGQDPAAILALVTAREDRKT